MLTATFRDRRLTLPLRRRPIHGLIFLFRYRADDVNKQEASCPDHVWYANQLHDKACATVALLNIVNNIPGADLGEKLALFKEFSYDMTPVQRGHAIGSFEFAKRVHNSFARKMDMLDTDLCLENQFDDRNKPIGKPKSAGKEKKGKVTQDDYADADAAFHFIAFVPIFEEIWKLDGLDRQPAKLGSVEGQDWLSLVVPDLSARMAQYEEDQIEFSILAVVRDPIESLGEQLKGIGKSLRAVESRLDMIKEDWRDYLDKSEDSPVTEANEIYISDDELSAEVLSRIDTGSSQKLMTYRQELQGEQSAVRAMLRDEETTQQMDREKARERRHDYGPLIHQWLRMLAEKDGVVKEILEDIR